ncbi:MAG: anthranilate phosphoribosyltransferase [Planctomycetes bacterium]|nr:anthranilate phosphoribosyltransferase [Planctomycetota bacterium]
MGKWNYPDLLNAVLDGQDLSAEQARWAFDQIMSGGWKEAKIAGLLVALSAKGEAPDELVGAAQAMREHSLKVPGPSDQIVDTCGTGGTGVRTFNISTASAIVAAGAGVKVAKHGNRTNSRASGSADVLAALGVKIDVTPAVMARCLEQAGCCFCFAVVCHPAMKHAGPVRKELGIRTIFNFLGPLTNPAGARRQVMGVFDPDLTETIAQVLSRLGSLRAMVVHSDDGLDEISISAPTKISKLQAGQIFNYWIRPEDFGLHRADLGELLVDSPAESAELIRTVFSGRRGPARDVVMLNAAAAILVADRSGDMHDAIAQAGYSIDSGAAKTTLEKLIAISNEG